MKILVAILTMLAAACTATPAFAGVLVARCDTFAATLALAQPGDTVKLEGDCPRIEIATKFARTVTIDAEKASVAGVWLTGENIAWRGGILTAPKGREGVARDGYAVFANGRNLSVRYATITDAKKGVVLDGARNVEITDNHFWRLREDGVIANLTVNLAIDRNSFSASSAEPNRCDGVPTETAQRTCAGKWTSGDHPGAVQLRNGVVNARIRWNIIEGNTAGIGHNDLKGVDAPIRDVLVEGNRVEAATHNPIKLQDNCISCRIVNNTVRRGRPDWKATIKAGAATSSGNVVDGVAVD